MQLSQMLWIAVRHRSYLFTVSLCCVINVFNDKCKPKETKQKINHLVSADISLLISVKSLSCSLACSTPRCTRRFSSGLSATIDWVLNTRKTSGEYFEIFGRNFGRFQKQWNFFYEWFLFRHSVEIRRSSVFFSEILFQSLLFDTIRWNGKLLIPWYHKR